VSIAALEWACAVKGLTPLEKAVLKEIANHYNNEDRKAWPSQSRLAAHTGYDRRSILRAVKSLEEKGLVVRVPAFKVDSNARTSNRYFLPSFDPGAVPRTKNPFAVEERFSFDGKYILEEEQVDGAAFSALHLKCPSEV
jgi:DNA-binding transcriptional MocR family regulator